MSPAGAEALEPSVGATPTTQHTQHEHGPAQTALPVQGEGLHS